MVSQSSSFSRTRIPAAAEAKDLDTDASRKTVSVVAGARYMRQYGRIKVFFELQQTIIGAIGEIRSAGRKGE